MKNKVIELLESTGRNGIEGLITHMNDIGYFTCPASTSYHGSKEGGLLEQAAAPGAEGISGVKALYDGQQFGGSKARVYALGRCSQPGSFSTFPASDVDGRCYRPRMDE